MVPISIKLRTAEITRAKENSFDDRIETPTIS
jgi:hypothetical protein